MKIRNFINKALLLTAVFGLLSTTTIKSAAAQTCYSNLNGSNTYYDGSASYKLNTTVSPLSYTMSFPTTNKIKAGGITIFWRYSTDAATVKRAIGTLPGYKSFSKSGEGTYSGKGSLGFLTSERKIYYFYYKFTTQRGDVLTGIWKVAVS